MRRLPPSVHLPVVDLPARQRPACNPHPYSSSPASSAQAKAGFLTRGMSGSPPPGGMLREGRGPSGADIACRRRHGPATCLNRRPKPLRLTSSRSIPTIRRRRRVRRRPTPLDFRAGRQARAPSRRNSRPSRPIRPRAAHYGPPSLCRSPHRRPARRLYADDVRRSTANFGAARRLSSPAGSTRRRSRPRSSRPSEAGPAVRTGSACRRRRSPDRR